MTAMTQRMSICGRADRARTCVRRWADRASGTGGTGRGTRPPRCPSMSARTTFAFGEYIHVEQINISTLRSAATNVT